MDDDTEVWGMAAAIRNHLAMRPAKPYSADEIAEFGGDWPAKPWPMSLVLPALVLLEETEVVESVDSPNGQRWMPLSQIK